MKKVMWAKFTPEDGWVRNANGDSARVEELLGDWTDESEAFLGGLSEDDTDASWPDVDIWTQDTHVELRPNGQVLVEVTVRWEEES